MDIDPAPRTPATRTRPASQTSPDGAGGGSPAPCPPTLPDTAVTPTAPPAAKQTTGGPGPRGASGLGGEDG
eukprot:2960021-Lingulodinium_polyedra.AAC.1